MAISPPIRDFRGPLSAEEFGRQRMAQKDALQAALTPDLELDKTATRLVPAGTRENTIRDLRTSRGKGPKTEETPIAMTAALNKGAER